MYKSLVSVMREVVEDLETNYQLHPRAREWRARLMERLLEYGDREDSNNNDQSEVNNNNNIPQHPQQGTSKTRVKLLSHNLSLFPFYSVAGPPPPPPPPVAPAPPKPKLLRFPGAEGK